MAVFGEFRDGQDVELKGYFTAWRGELQTIRHEVEDELPVASLVAEQLREVVLVERVSENRANQLYVLLFCMKWQSADTPFH